MGGKRRKSGEVVPQFRCSRYVRFVDVCANLLPCRVVTFDFVVRANVRDVPPTTTTRADRGPFGAAIKKRRRRKE